MSREFQVGDVAWMLRREDEAPHKVRVRHVGPEGICVVWGWGHRNWTYTIKRDSEDLLLRTLSQALEALELQDERIRHLKQQAAPDDHKATPVETDVQDLSRLDAVEEKLRLVEKHLTALVSALGSVAKETR
jgi:hypothetical protein